MFLERVAERVSSLSKLKSVLVTDSHAQLLQRPCSATSGHEQRRRRLPSSSGDARCPAGRVDGLQRQNRAVCAGTRMPAHILPGTRGCSPSGAAAGAHLRFSRKFWFGWQAAGRQAGFRSGWRAQAAHSPFARSSRSAAAQSGSAGRQAAAHREPFRRSGKEETCTHAHMYSDGNSARDKTQTRGHAAMS